MVLTFSVFIQSFTMLIFVITNFMIGLKIALRYFETELWEILRKLRIVFIYFKFISPYLPKTN
jgi:hypothetical protein